MATDYTADKRFSGIFTQEQFQELLQRKSSPLRDIEWVGNHLAIVHGVGCTREQFRDLAMRAPSLSALGCLMWALASGMNEKDFWIGMYAKTLPSKGQIESESRYADDGRKQLQHVDRIFATIAESGTEDL